MVTVVLSEAIPLKLGVVLLVGERGGSSVTVGACVSTTKGGVGPALAVLPASSVCVAVAV